MIQARSNTILMQNAAAATGNGAVLGVETYQTALFVLSGTYSATVTFEASLDGATWFQWFAFNHAGTRGGTATATGIYLAPVVGMFQARARISAYTSGSVTVLGKAIVEPIDVYMFGQQEATQDGDQLDIDWNPTYYTPDATPTEADDVDDLTAHLYGIDVAIASKASTNHDATHITAGSDEIDGDKLDIDWTPTYYTPDATPAEADNVDNLTAHLYGIDQYIGLAQTDIDTNTSDIAANAAAMLEKDGSVALTANWDIGDARAILADTIRARDAAGLNLQDDGGNGITVADGGKVTITVAAGATEDMFLMEINETSPDFFAIKNGTGTAGSFLPIFEGHTESTSLPALLFLSGTAVGNDTGSVPIIQIQARRGDSTSGSAITTRPVLRIANYTTALLDVSAAGILNFLGTMGNSTKDPTADAPTDWVQIAIGGTTYYLPAYAA